MGSDPPEGLSPERARQLTDAIRAWPASQQPGWRALLEEHPDQALLVAEAAADLGGWPCDELGYPITR